MINALNTEITGISDNETYMAMYIGNVYGLDSHKAFGGDVFDGNGLARALMARDYKDPILVLEGNMKCL